MFFKKHKTATPYFTSLRTYSIKGITKSVKYKFQNKKRNTILT